MANNIFKIISEDDFMYALKNHDMELIVTMFCSKTGEYYTKMKICLLELATQNPDCFFIFIDINNFKQSTYKYDIKPPKTLFFLYNQLAAHYLDTDILKIKEIFAQIKIKMKQMNYNPPPKQDETQNDSTVELPKITEPKEILATTQQIDPKLVTEFEEQNKQIEIDKEMRQKVEKFKKEYDIKMLEKLNELKKMEEITSKKKNKN